ncbi:diaminopimelate decarboxylase [Parasphingorhabdus sp. JC815]|uniref:diaminopimelate decarboxylase n=1 Tax=Parasphingorhabdus sp. JC815 TaxID=3232140 RepID=UPI003459B931
MKNGLWWEREDLCYLDGRLQFAGQDVSSLTSQTAGPLYLYSAERVTRNLRRLTDALKQTGSAHQIYYAMKANRFVPLLEMIARTGLCGVDICSPGELDRALASGFAPSQISFTGTGVSGDDLDRLLQYPDVHINCDTIGMIRRIGERKPNSSIGIRVNPAMGTGYDDSEKLIYSGGGTTKFGIYREQWPEALAMVRKYGLMVNTLHFHVGCGYLSGQLDRWENAVKACASFLKDLPDIKTVNIGGGLGLPHRKDDEPLDFGQWADILSRHIGIESPYAGLTIAVEPGDFIVKDAGMLVLTVNDVEMKRGTLFAYVNGGFNLAPEPAFYDLPCEPVACIMPAANDDPLIPVTIAGNINEALDIWAIEHPMPNLHEGDFIAFINAGGYAASMASNHCMRGAATEFLV